LIENSSLWRGGVGASLTPLRLESCLGEPLLRRLEIETDDVRDLEILRNYARWEEHERGPEVGNEKPSNHGNNVRNEAADRAAPIHCSTLRRRAAKAPSVPWRCGSTRSRPASSTAAGTTPSGGGSSCQPG